MQSLLFTRTALPSPSACPSLLHGDSQTADVRTSDAITWKRCNEEVFLLHLQPLLLKQQQMESPFTISHSFQVSARCDGARPGPSPRTSCYELVFVSIWSILKSNGRPLDDSSKPMYIYSTLPSLLTSTGGSAGP